MGDVVDYTSRNADKFVVRLPEGMRDKIARRARVNHQSMNSHIISILEKDLESEGAAPTPSTNTEGRTVTIGQLVHYKLADDTYRFGVIQDIKVQEWSVFVTFDKTPEPVWHPIGHIFPFLI